MKCPYCGSFNVSWNATLGMYACGHCQATFERAEGNNGGWNSTPKELSPELIDGNGGNG